MVRSKSEQSIGNMLEEYGIDYSYDRRVDGHLYYADFTIYCQDGSKIIWEHFGLMDSDTARIITRKRCGEWRTIADKDGDSGGT